MKEDENDPELFHVSRIHLQKIVLVQNSMFNDTLVNFLFVVYMTQIRMSLCSRIKD